MSLSQLDKAIKFRTLHGLTARSRPTEQFARPHQDSVPSSSRIPGTQASARILAGLGFQALATTSAGFAFSLGRSDGAVTREEALAHSAVDCRATDLPVSRRPREFVSATIPRFVARNDSPRGATGLVGGSVEDASGDENRSDLRSRACRRTRCRRRRSRSGRFRFRSRSPRAPKIHLHGRTDLDDTIRRLQAFAAAGADVALCARSSEPRSNQRRFAPPSLRSP